MERLESHRRTAFALALAALLATGLAVNLIGGDAGHESPAGAPDPGRALGSAQPRTRGAGSAPDDRIVTRAATRFVTAYLRYEEGVRSSSVREAIAKSSTKQLGTALLGEPVRLPPAGRPPRQWLARVAAVRAGLLGGREALIATLVVVGVDGGHTLRASLVRRNSRWLVAGIGP